MSVAAWWYAGTAETQILAESSTTGQLNLTLDNIILSSDVDVAITGDFSNVISFSLSAQGTVEVPTSAFLNLVLDNIQLSASVSSQVIFIVRQQSIDFDVLDNYNYTRAELIYNNDVPDIMNSKPDKPID